MANFKDRSFTSFTKLAFVLLFSNSADELVVTSGVIISDGRLIGDVLLILIEVSFDILKLSKSSTASQDVNATANKRAIAINFDFIFKISLGFSVDTKYFGFWIFVFQVQRCKGSEVQSKKTFINL